ncbi:YbhB/YbcL family Raf kinase inhibitor-like protein [Pseudomaricurvus alcaniphilus]|uniref:YbhB/YbcL family Raf kinase inhibitor-like protein n=1 Tax=Pseudomaricurvus alcaniphilus TaxID=1166482 RepID=UPI001407C713|nr:YbhB/YbcL family Raf kinase inhibitor-like protein [Pseudomaricurvus alcaniphilus]NHN36241.1 YbhB/YbcL family Raf kinase inhibitor-like protein [Pseudomaricurvus alcaniphilus]
MGFALSPMQLTSASFQAGQAIPKRCTMEGENTSPQLSWTEAPEGSKAFAIICHDPDAPLVSPGSYGFVHWVLYNIPASTSSLEENSTIGTAGKNDFGESGYGGPMPPPGHGDHHYFFSLLALDKDVKLPPGLSMWELLEKIEPHVIGMNRLVGLYQR